jgi:hypothetical protein
MRQVHARFNALPTQQRPSLLVLLFEDAECFSSETLQLLIHVCSEYAGRLPFVFIFGVATSPERLYSLLPPSAIAKLRIEQFSLAVSRQLVCAYITHAHTHTQRESASTSCVVSTLI